MSFWSSLLDVRKTSLLTVFFLWTRLWNSLPAKYFPFTYELNGCQYLTLGSFIMSSPICFSILSSSLTLKWNPSLDFAFFQGSGERGRGLNISMMLMVLLMNCFNETANQQNCVSKPFFSWSSYQSFLPWLDPMQHLRSDFVIWSFASLITCKWCLCWRISQRGKRKECLKGVDTERRICSSKVVVVTALFNEFKTLFTLKLSPCLWRFWGLQWYKPPMMVMAKNEYLLAFLMKYVTTAEFVLSIIHHYHVITPRWWCA